MGGAGERRGRRDNVSICRLNEKFKKAHSTVFVLM